MEQTTSSKLREEYRALWRNNKRPTGLIVRPEVLDELALEYGSTDHWAVHWLLYGLDPVPDKEDILGDKKWKFTSVKFKPWKRKNEELLASVQ